MRKNNTILETIDCEAKVAEFFKDKTHISIYDDITFPNNKSIFNIIFGQDFKGSYQPSGAGWDKLFKRYGREDNLFPWFPLKTKRIPSSKGYFNIISEDEICEYNIDERINALRKAEMRHIGEKRVVFVRQFVKGKTQYYFAGVFFGDRYDEEGKLFYKHIEKDYDKFEIVR